MQSTVSKDRDKYIGGSDIPIIMGISPFKSRFDLLLEKAGLKESDFSGNEYTEYGNIMEEKIRSYINKQLGKTFVEGKHIYGDIRCHTDGEDYTTILEIKTTSQIHNNVDDYKVYLVQLLFYMVHTDRKAGILAVYNRPDDFNTLFDESRLQIFTIRIENYNELIDKINTSVEQFKKDLKIVKDNPFVSEQDLLPVDLNELSYKVISLENKLAEYDEIEKESKQLKSQLKEAMEKYCKKTWETPNGIKITLIEDAPDKEIEVEIINEEKFIRENLELHETYQNKLAEYKEIKKELKKGKKGYVKITLPKNGKDDKNEKD